MKKGRGYIKGEVMMKWIERNMHKVIRSILAFIIRHKTLEKIFSKWKWYNELVIYEAHRWLWKDMDN